MEDKVAIYENLNIFHKSDTSLSARPISLFGVFDGHCGVDCSQYVSSHLPLYIVQQQEFTNLSQLKNNEFINSMNSLLTRSFKIINQRFSEKAVQEVN
jgi:serine/threonine protein phosphatase PrpC